MLNLGIPEAYDHILERMSAILGEYDIAYIKWDHNRDLIDAGTAPHGRAGVHDQTLATYRLMDELKRRFPDWRSNPARRAERGWTSESSSAPTAPGSRTASIRSSASR